MAHLRGPPSCCKSGVPLRPFQVIEVARMA